MTSKSNYNEYDILYGRGLFIQSHPGNKRYRKVVQNRKTQYAMMTTTQDKNAVAIQVLQDIKMLNPPSRFLVRRNDAGSSDEWSLVQNESSILTKIKQALRENPAKNIAARSKSTKERQEEAGDTPRAKKKDERNPNGYVPKIVRENSSKESKNKKVREISSFKKHGK